MCKWEVRGERTQHQEGDDIRKCHWEVGANPLGRLRETEHTNLWAGVSAGPGAWRATFQCLGSFGDRCSSEVNPRIREARISS